MPRFRCDCSKSLRRNSVPADYGGLHKSFAHREKAEPSNRRVNGPNDKVFTFWAVEKFSSQGKIPNTKMNLPGFDYLRGQSLAKLIDAERRATAAAMVEVQRPNCTFTVEK